MTMTEIQAIERAVARVELVKLRARQRAIEGCLTLNIEELTYCHAEMMAVTKFLAETEPVKAAPGSCGFCGRADGHEDNCPMMEDTK